MVNFRALILGYFGGAPDVPEGDGNLSDCNSLGKYPFDPANLFNYADPQGPKHSSEDSARLKRYRENRLIYDGHFTQVWKGLDDLCFVGGESIRSQRFQVVVVNDAPLITDTIANLLFREEPTVVVKEEAAAEKVHALIKQTNLWPRSKEAAKTQSSLGDAVAQIYLKDGQVHLRYLDPSLFFGIFNPFDAEELLGAYLQWDFQHTGSDGETKTYLYKQSHLPGVIINSVFELDKKGRIVKEVALSSLPPVKNLNPVERTDVDEILLELVTNNRPASSSYGVSDYTQSLKSKFRTRTAIATQYDIVRAKNSNPLLGLPQSVVDSMKNEAGQITMTPEQLGFFGVTKEDGNGGYLEWDGELNAAKEEFNMLLDQILREAKIAPSLAGVSIEGIEGGETGRANLLKMLPTLGLADSKQEMWKQPLKNIIRKMQKLANQATEETSVVSEVEIVFQDGLPADGREQAEVQSLLVGAGLKSRFTAIKEQTGWSDELVQDELDRISEEKQSNAAPVPPAPTDPAGLEGEPPVVEDTD